jgi:CDP-diacylglycerol--glycerol-3-phosphate 3-phosphatidyltransferase
LSDVARTRPPAAEKSPLRHNPPMFFNLPTLFTWARILAIPLVVGVYYTALPAETQNVVGTALFIIVSLTDWADGYLARRLGMTSSFGAFLDPVADKLFVSAALLVLVHLGRVHALIALIIIGREIAISALREWMAQIGAARSVAVHMVGKVKTVVQMIAIPFLLYHGTLFRFIDTQAWGTVLIAVSAVLTIWSMVYYLQKALPEIRARVR